MSNILTVKEQVTFYDLHTHHPPAYGNTAAIVNCYWPQPEPQVEHFSAGLHPWYLKDSEKLNDAWDWLTQIAANPNCVAIGEAGLDRLVKTDWDVQMLAFKHCVQCSIDLRKPLIIHCVRAFDEVLAVKKQMKKEGETIPWIFHGFNKKPEIARKLLGAGCYLSFGAALLDSRFPAAAALRMCPDDRFFLETDDRADISIQEIYAAAADIRGVAVEEIGGQVEVNFQRFFPEPNTKNSV